MKYLIVLLAVIGAVVGQTCKYSKDNINSNWRMVNGGIQINYQNKRIMNNQWTAIGFGQSMQDLSVVVFMVQNNQVTVRTGRTNGYGPPQFDNQNNVQVQSSMFSGNNLNAMVTVPLNSNGKNLQQCMTWNFVGTGPLNNGQLGVHSARPNQLQNVCASQCR